MKIRVATIDDIGQMVDVYSEWSKFESVLPADLVETETYDDLVKYFDNPSLNRLYLLAIDDNGIILGICYIDTSFLNLNNIRLGDMMVREQVRNQGVGSRLIEEVIVFARKNNIKKIWLWTHEELKSAIQLYEKMGFVLEARLAKHFCNKDTLQFGLLI